MDAKACRDLVRIEEIKVELQDLLKGTKHLSRFISTERFVANVAKHIQERDPAFIKEEAIDFILRVFVDGSVRGKGGLTDAERKDYYRRLEEEIFTCSHTGLRVHFFVSFLFGQFDQ